MKRIVMALCLTLVLAGYSSAQTIRVSLAADIPPDVIDSKNGLLVDLIREMNKLPGTTKFEIIGAFPFPRSIANVVTGKADLHLPLLENPNTPAESLDFAYSTAVITVVPFVLYTNVDKSIDKNKIGDYNVFIQPAHLDFFPGGKGEMPIEAALKRLNNGDIDGYICAIETGDGVLEKFGFNRVNRQLMAEFEAKAVIPKGEKGKPVDKAFSDAVNQLKGSGRLRQVYPGFVYTD